MKKRFLTYFMALTMVVSLLPTTALANDTDEMIVDEIIWDDVAEEEEDFQISWTYVTNEDGSITAIENELVTDEDMANVAGLMSVASTSSSSTNSFGLTENAQDTTGLDPYGAGDGAANINPFYELLTDTAKASSITMQMFDDAGNGGNYWANSEESISVNKVGSKAYSRTVAFDATGCGKDNYVARLSMEKDGSDYALDVYSVDGNGNLTFKYYVGLGTIDVSADIKVWEISSFMDIVAGDFDGDGKDEVAVTNLANVSTGDNNLVSIYGINGSSFTQDKTLNLKSYLPYLTYSSGDMSRDKFPVLSLTAGTLYADGDLADDLVVSISTNNKSVLEDAADNGGAAATLLIYSSQGKDTLPTTPTTTEKYTFVGVSNSNNMVPRNMSTSIGDIDNDGAMDLVVACEASMNSFANIFNWAITQTSSGTVYNYMTAYTTSTNSVGLSNKTDGDWVQHTSPAQEFGDGNYIFEPVAITTYDYMGQLDGELVYIEGNTYQYDSGTFNYIGEQGRPTTDWGPDKDVYWISEAVAGNVFHSPMGNEAVFHTYGMQHENGKYLFDAAYAYCDEEGDWSKNYKEFAYHINYDASLSLALVDYDEDGLIVKANPAKDTDYYFTDPDIMAVLQAAPRFSELDEVDGNYATNGSTALSKADSTSSEVSNGLAVSAGISVGFEYEAQFAGLVPAVGASESLTTTASFSSSWTTATETTSSITYTSYSDADRLVLSMIPYVRYHYLMWVPEFELMSLTEYNAYKSTYNTNIEAAKELAEELGSSAGLGSSDKDKTYLEYVSAALEAYDEYSAMDTMMADGYSYGDTIEGIWQEYEISVPNTPITAIMTVDSFDKVATSMGWDKISNNILPTGYTAGYPTTYPTSTSGLDNWSAAVKDYSSVFAGGGSTTQTLEGSKSSTTSLSYGLEIEHEIGGIVAGATASATQSIGYEGGYAWSNGTGVAYEGTVENTPAGCDAYTFDWLFGTYTAPFNADPSEDEYDVLVLGYVLDKVNAPPSTAQNLEVTEATQNSLTLTWEKGMIPAAQYIIYAVIDNGVYELATVDGSTTEFVDINLLPGTSYSYSMIAQDASGASSVSSPVVTGKTVSEAGGITATLDQTDLTLGIGGTVGITVTMTPDAGLETLGNPSYQWQEKSGSSWSNITNATSTTYTISDVTSDMDGTQYRCIVTQMLADRINTAQATSDVATLSVGLLKTTTTVTATNSESQTNSGPAAGTSSGSTAEYDVTVTNGDTEYAVYQYNGAYYLYDGTHYYTVNDALATEIATIVSTYHNESGEDDPVTDIDWIDETYVIAELTTSQVTSITVPTVASEENLGTYTEENDVYTASGRTFTQESGVWYETTDGEVEVYNVLATSGDADEATTVLKNEGTVICEDISALVKETAETEEIIFAETDKTANYAKYTYNGNTIYYSLGSETYYLAETVPGSAATDDKYDKMTAETKDVTGDEITTITVGSDSVYKIGNAYYGAKTDGDEIETTTGSDSIIVDDALESSYSTMVVNGITVYIVGDAYYTGTEEPVLVGTSADPETAGAEETAISDSIIVDSKVETYIATIEVDNTTYYKVGGDYYTAETESYVKVDDTLDTSTESPSITIGDTAYTSYDEYDVNGTSVYVFGTGYYANVDGTGEYTPSTANAAGYSTIEVGSTTVYVQDGVLYTFTAGTAEVPESIKYTALTAKEETATVNSLLVTPYGSDITITEADLGDAVDGNYSYAGWTITKDATGTYTATQGSVTKTLTTSKTTEPNIANFTEVVVKYTTATETENEDAYVSLKVFVTKDIDGSRSDVKTTVKFTILNTTTGVTSTVSTTTTDYGYAYAIWVPTTAGVYTITAEFNGNSSEAASTSESVTYYVTGTTDQYFVEINGPSSIAYTDDGNYTVKVVNGDGKEVSDLTGGTLTYGSTLADCDTEYDSTNGITLTADSMDSKTIYAKYTFEGKEFTTSFKVSIAKKDINITAEKQTVELSVVSANASDYANQTISASETWIAVEDSDGAYDVSEAYYLSDILNASYNVIPTMGDYAITLSYTSDSASQTYVSDFKSKYNPTLIPGTYTVTGEMYELTYSAGTNGVVKARNQTNTTVASGTQVIEGYDITLTATPEDGYIVEKWIINDEEWKEGSELVTDLTYSISSIAKDYDIEVYFTAAQHIFDKESTDNGTVTAKYYYAVSGADGTTFTFGGNIFESDYVRVTATPADGYVVESWQVKTGNGAYETILAADGTSNYTDTMRVFSSLKDDTTIKVNFAEKEVATITVQVLNGTAAVANTTVTFNDVAADYVAGTGYTYTGLANENIVIAVSVPDGIKINTWTTDGVVSSDRTYATLYAISGDATVTVDCTAANNYSVAFGGAMSSGSVADAGEVTASITGESNSIISGVAQQQGSEVNFTATVNKGYEITGWTLNGVAVEATEDAATGTQTYKVASLDESVTIVVTYAALPTATLTYSVIDKDEVENSGIDGTLTATVARNDMDVYDATGTTVDATVSTLTVYRDSTITFTATPDSGYAVDKWIVDGVEQTTAPTITIDEQEKVDVQVQFVAVGKRIYYSVNDTDTGATISAYNELSEQAFASGNFVAADNTTITLTVDIPDGYHLESWTVDGTVVDGETKEIYAYVAKLDVGAIIVANVVRDSYIVSFSGTNGVVTAEVDENAIATGDAIVGDTTVSFKVESNAGYAFTGWSVNGVDQGTENTTLTVTIKENTTVVATSVSTEDMGPYDVTLVASENGTISATVDGVAVEGDTFTANRGDVIVVTATPNTYFYTSLWTVNGTATESTGNTYTIAELLEDTIIKADFAIAERALLTAYVVGENGSLTTMANETAINPENGIPVDAGAKITLTAVPDKDDPETPDVETEYMVKEWKINGEVQDNLSNALVIESFTEETLVTVEYEPLVLHAIPETVADSYEVTSVDKTPADYGDDTEIRDRGDVTFTITPESGRYITSLVIGGVELVSVAADLEAVTCADSMSYTMVGTSYVITLEGVTADVVADVTALLFEVKVEELTSESEVTVKEWDEEKEEYIDVVVTGATVTSDMMTDVTTEIGTPTAVITQEVQLMVGTVVGEEIEWTPATEDNFPDNGITIQLPLPEALEDKTLEELQKSNYEFVVVHYIVSPINGKVPGETETFSIKDGTMEFVDLGEEIVLELTVFSLSPFAIAYTYTESTGGSTGGSSGGGGGGGGGSSSSDDDEEEVVEEEIVVEGDELTHESYISGYADGTFKPNNSMTRAEALTMFANLMEDPMDKSKTYSTSFTDVVDADWFKNIVGFMESYKIISGYDDGTFGGNNTITRAEFIAVAVRFAGVDMISGNTFSDIASSKSSWASNHISTAVAYGWVSGYEDGTFMPDKQITRAEAVTVINNIMGRSYDADYIAEHDVNKFSDVSETHWAFGGIMEASVDHTYVADGDSEIWVDTE